MRRPVINFWLSVLLLFFCPCSASLAAGDGLVVSAPVAVGAGSGLFYEGYFPATSRYSPWGLQMPVSYVVPMEQGSPSSGPLRLVVFLHPDDGGRGSWVDRPWPPPARSDRIEVRNQEDSYRDGKGGWWGYAGGQAGRAANYNGERIAASIDHVLGRFGDRVDLGAGIILRGKSLGGTGVILQSMIMPRHREHIAIVESTIGNLLFVKCCYRWVRRAWAGISPETADFRVRAPELTDIHFFWRGGSNDNLGHFDIEFFEICETYRISCAGVWLKSGHGTREKGYSLPTALFMDPNQDVRRDQVLPVITHFTGSFHGPERGHHNRGISWHQRGVVDSPAELRVPLKYEAMKAIGEGVPDQPASITFSLTPRRVKHFELTPGEGVRWRFGEQTGNAWVDSRGILTVDGLALDSGAGYMELVVTHEFD